MNQAISDAASIKILYITRDLMDSDYLAHSLQKVAPGMHLDPSVPDFKRVDQLLGTSAVDVVLLDNRIAAAEKLLLIAHLDSQKLIPALIIIIGAEEKRPVQELLALSDDHIVRGPNFVNGLADLLKQVFVRCKLGIRRRSSVPQLSEAESIPTAEAESSTTTQPKESDLRTFPRKQVNIPCRLDWKGDIFAARIRDLSEFGAFIETPILPRNGASIRIFFDLNNGKIIQEAIVVHEGWYLGTDNNFYGCGVQFGNVTEDARCAYQKIILGSSEPAMSKITLTP